MSGLAEQCAWIAETGAAGVETIVFEQTPLDRWQDELRTAAVNAGLMPVAVILGGLALYRAGQLPWIKDVLAAAAELGASVLLTPEYRPQDPLPIFPPYTEPPVEEVRRLKDNLNAIVAYAVDKNVPLFFEPLTPFEGRFWRSVEDTLSAAHQYDHPDVGVCLDFHNMNITEADINASIRQAGRSILHVHLADNNRRLPGQGHVDFAAGLAALKAVHYSGWYTFECAAEADFTASVQHSIATLRRIYQQCV
ncbi:MAG: sugar phosphate isomerase/epimerase [Caldilineaceae bacterium]|nr:sugar phosphate isomerase/epimerase [Caldilineaceae bacterium]